MFKQVRPNENFRPSAEFHNATARLLNNLGTIGDGRFRGKRGGGGSAYDGPFAVKGGNGIVTVNGGNVLCGRYVITVQGVNLNPYIYGDTPVVYGHVYNGSTGEEPDYRCEIRAGRALPAQGAREVYFRIATLAEETGIVQCQYGDYTVGGRVV